MTGSLKGSPHNKQVRFFGGASTNTVGTLEEGCEALKGLMLCVDDMKLYQL
jgi:hypothetical protein